MIKLGNSQLKNRTPIGSAIDTKLLNELKDYSNKTSIPLSKLLDKSIEMYLKEVKK